MDILLIILIFLLAMICLTVEVLSGTIKFGIISLFLTILGITVTYFTFGMDTAIWTLGVSSVFNIGAITYSIRSKSWEKFSQKQVSEGKFDDKDTERKLLLYPEQEGKTISSLKPIGKANFEGEVFEVRSVNGEFIEAGQKVFISKIESPKIYVSMHKDVTGSTE